jgi:hypothetical protein
MMITLVYIIWLFFGLGHDQSNNGVDKEFFTEQ